MDGIMNDNQLTIVKEYELDNPLIQKIDSIFDNCIRDCHDKFYHTFDHICEYNPNCTNTSNNEIVNFTISNKCMRLYELNKKLTVARERCYIFNQINKLTIKIRSNLSHINIHYHPRLGSSPLYRQFFIKISKNRDYIQIYCNDRRRSFHFACRQWYSYNNPQTML